MSFTLLFSIYLVSVSYCVYKMVTAYKKIGIDPTYTTPGLDTLVIMVMAPVLMVVDVTLTWIRLYKEAEESRKQMVHNETLLNTSDFKKEEEKIF